MTPLEFAKLECANFQSDGSCLGIVFNDQGKTISAHRLENCKLKIIGQRCVYFEECVMPMAGRMEGKKAHLNLQYDEAGKFYRHKANVAKTVLRSCPVCGRELEPRKRYCYLCRDVKRRETFKNSRPQPQP